TDSAAVPAAQQREEPEHVDGDDGAERHHDDERRFAVVLSRLLPPCALGARRAQPATAAVVSRQLHRGRGLLAAATDARHPQRRMPVHAHWTPGAAGTFLCALRRSTQQMWPSAYSHDMTKSASRIASTTATANASAIATCRRTDGGRGPGRCSAI